MINVNEIKFKYMNQEITLGMYFKYSKNPKLCYSPIYSDIVYLNKSLADIPIKKNTCADEIAEYVAGNPDAFKFVLIKVIKNAKLKSVPDYVADMLSASDIDDVYDNFIKFLFAVEGGKFTGK